jgi:hypothetical protein
MGLLGELLTRIYHEVGQRPPYVIRRTAGIDADADLVADPVAALAGGGPSPVDVEDDDQLPARDLRGRGGRLRPVG